MGVVVYEWLTGTLPFQGSSAVDIVVRHVNVLPSPPDTINPAISASVGSVVLKALAKRPQDRYVSIHGFANALERAWLESLGQKVIAAAPSASTSEGVFIIYVPSDAEFVARLRRDLELRGISIWREAEEVLPGTAGWEEAQRTAILNADAILYIVSPNVRRFAYVNDGLAIARMYQRPVYPIWIAGTQWIDVVPLSLQYIDAREPTRYEAVVNQIVRVLGGVASGSDEVVLKPEQELELTGQTSTTTPSPSAQAIGEDNKSRLVPGTILAERYQIEKMVALGGIVAVYRAVDIRSSRPYAVKEIIDELQREEERRQAGKRFQFEANLMLNWSHPGIPRAYDFFERGNRHYLVMEWIEGRTLSEILEKEGNVAGVNGARGVPEARARNWAQQLCRVLSYLHRQSPPIVFRALKPSNVMVTDREEVKLVDFDMARIFQAQGTINTNIGYPAPEQVQGRPEPRSDIYALGATLYRVLTHYDIAKNTPNVFTFPSLRTLRPDVSPEFEQVVMKALEPEVEKRWASAEEMERAIVKVLQPSYAPLRGTLQEMERTVLPQQGSTGNQAVSLRNARVLVEIDGKIVGEYVLNKPVVTVGRISSIDVLVPNQRVSRLHAKILWRNGAWILEDADSSNGMIHQGTRVESLVLRDGDRVYLAPTVVLEYKETST